LKTQQKNIAGVLTVLAMALCFWGRAAADDSVGIDKLRWLTGCWASEGGESGSGEQWTRPAGGTLLGINRTVRGGKTTAFEFMRIVETGKDDGELIFIASPSGQSTATFLLSTISQTEVVFANPDHDFPQRIGYRRTPGGGLLGWIDGNINGQDRRIEFPMTAIDCLEVADVR